MSRMTRMHFYKLIMETHGQRACYPSRKIPSTSASRKTSATGKASSGA